MLVGAHMQMGMKEDTDEVTARTRVLSLELLQVRWPTSNCLYCLLTLNVKLHLPHDFNCHN